MAKRASGATAVQMMHSSPSESRYIENIVVGA